MNVSLNKRERFAIRSMCAIELRRIHERHPTGQKLSPEEEDEIHFYTHLYNKVTANWQVPLVERKKELKL